MKLINDKEKFVVICAWCENEKTKEYQQKGFTVSHGICEKCSEKYFKF